jgi:hypothetical protein
MKLTDLIIVIVIGFLLFSLGVKAIQSANEEADRLLCIVNMKKLAAGIREYEDKTGYLPPAKTANNHPAWNLRILPYMGYTAVHELLTRYHLYDRDYQGVLGDTTSVPVNPYDIGDRNSIGAISTFSGNPKTWYRFTCQTSGTVSDAFTQNDGDGIVWSEINRALSQIPEYRNPSRQPVAVVKKVTGDLIYTNSFTNLKFNNDQYEQSCMRGAVSDFATAFAKFPTALMSYAIDKDGAFTDVTRSIVMDTSNIYVLAEKHVPAFALIGDTPIANMWNGGLHRTHAAINAFNGSLRYVNLDPIPTALSAGTTDKNGVLIVTEKHPIAVTNNEVENELSFLIGNSVIRYPSNFQTGEYLWGSTHPSTLNVGTLDGGVKPVNKDINADIFNNSWRQSPKKQIFVD